MRALHPLTHLWVSDWFVLQVYSFMAKHGLAYGILSDYDSTWLLMANRRGVLRISDAIPYDQQGDHCTQLSATEVSTPAAASCAYASCTSLSCIAQLNVRGADTGPASWALTLKP